MNNRQCVLATLNHKQPGKIPYDIRFTQKAHAKMVEYYGDPDFASKLGNRFTFLLPYPGGVQYRLINPENIAAIIEGPPESVGELCGGDGGGSL
jgi:hypothetical protein